MSNLDPPSIEPTPQPPAPPVIPLPPPLNAVTKSDDYAERARRRERRLDGALALAVGLFAFLIASSAVRHGDFWQHLATGRLLATGQFPFGADPFAYTTADQRWVHAGWLFDLALYAWYQLAGPAAVVVLMAVSVTLLTGLLLNLRTSQRGATLAAVATTLTLLALSPYLAVRPVLASYLLLGATYWLLVRPHFQPQNGRRWRIPLLLAIMVFWANLDSWFLLGPILMALVVIDERLAGRERPTPLWLVPVALLVCLANPYHVYVFRIPPDLLPALAENGLTQVPRFRHLDFSPWEFERYLRPTVGLNAAGLAYYALTGLGIVSFVLPSGGVRVKRLVLWLPFALLAAWQVQAVPFFAIIAGPITAANLAEALTHFLSSKEQERERTPTALTLTAQFGLCLGLLLLCVAAWPGWLRGEPREQHRVAWTVEPDPSLPRLATVLQQWRDEGRLQPEDRVLALHPDVAHYLVWAIPGERGFLDGRLSLFDKVSADYLSVARALESNAGTSDDWQAILHQHRVGVLILYESDPVRLFTPLQRMERLASGTWTLCGVAGAALLYCPSAVAQRMPPLESRAYGPSAPATTGELAFRPRRPTDWERFRAPAPAFAAESDEATLYLRVFEERAGRDQQQQLVSSLFPYAASLIAGPAIKDETGLTLARLLAPMIDAPRFLPRLHERPAALPLLAIRAARRALAVNSNDANAWLRLGQAYDTLRRFTGEQPAPESGQPPWQPILLLRHIQATYALHNALILDPDLEPAHRALAELYAERTYLDVALKHSQEALRLRRRGPQRGESAEEHRRFLAQEEKQVEGLERVVYDRTNEFAVQARPMTVDPLGRARLAIRLGLPRLALEDILLQSSVQLFGGNGARLQLELLLMLGQAHEVREALLLEEVRQSRQSLGEAELPAPSLPGYGPHYRWPAYEWLHYHQAATLGDHDEALNALDEIGAFLEDQETLLRRRLRQGLLSAVASEVALGTVPSCFVARVMERDRREQLRGYSTETPFGTFQRADLITLAGMVALEHGQTETARERFEEARKLLGPRGFAGEPLVRRGLRELRRP